MPNSPPRTWACETWCEWYQYVPASSATNRYTCCSPGATASWVTPATPSSAFGTSTPCQCSVTPSGTSTLDSVTCDQVALVRLGSPDPATCR